MGAGPASSGAWQAQPPTRTGYGIICDNLSIAISMSEIVAATEKPLGP